jgi:hypothetical protein
MKKKKRNKKKKKRKRKKKKKKKRIRIRKKKKIGTIATAKKERKSINTRTIVIVEIAENLKRRKDQSRNGHRRKSEARSIELSEAEVVNITEEIETTKRRRREETVPKKKSTSARDPDPVREKNETIDFIVISSITKEMTFNRSSSPCIQSHLPTIFLPIYKLILSIDLYIHSRYNVVKHYTIDCQSR